MKTIDDVPMILRREIEARIVAPFLKAFAEELGWEKTKEITSKVISQDAGNSGKGLAQAAGGNSLTNLGLVVNRFGSDGVLETEVTENSPECIRMNVTKCDYVDMYKRLGLEEMGEMLSCERDTYLFKGFNPDIEFTRTSTIMSGGRVCNFCLKIKKKE